MLHDRWLERDAIQAREVSDSETDRLLGEVAGEFFDRVARGENPAIEEYACRYPELADLIRETFPAVIAIDESVSSASSVDTSPAANVPIKGQLGDFQIVRELGRGGMGVVYEAEQISMRRRVALKVLPFAGMVQRNALKRFHNEVRAAASLDHRNIVSVYSIGEDRGVHFYAMQLIRGQSLAELIPKLRLTKNGGQSLTTESIREFVSFDEKGKLSISSDPNGKHSSQPRSHTDEPTKPAARADASTVKVRSFEFYRAVATLGAQAADALEHAHQNGVVHRDIKPGNLMLDGHMQLFVTDFGLARFESDAAMTMTGDLLGTLRYMSPEQALAKQVVIDHRTDIYSLGMTIYELLALRPAFRGSDRRELLKQIAFQEPEKPRHINRGIPPEMETIVLKAIEKNAADRYESAAAMAADLRAFLDDRPILAKRTSVSRRVAKWTHRNRPLVTTAAVSVIIAWLISSVWVWNERATAIKQRDLSNLHLRSSIEQRQRAEEGLELALDVLDEFLDAINEGRSVSAIVPMRDEQSLLRELGVFFQKIAELDGGEASLRTAAAYRRLGDTQFNLGQVKAARRSYDMALLQLTNLVSSEPDNPERKLELARCHAAYAMILDFEDYSGKLQSIRRAIEVLDQVSKANRNIKHVTTSLNCRYRLAMLLTSRRSGEAANVLSELIDQADNAVRSYDGQLDQVKTTRNDAHHLLGQIHRNHTGKLDLAEKHFRQAIKDVSERPQDARTLARWSRSLGVLQCLRGNPREAMSTLEEARKLFQENDGLPEHFARVDYNLAQALYDFGRLHEARQSCVRAAGVWTPPATRPGEECRRLILQGSIHHALADNASAEIAYRKAIDLLAATESPGRLAILAESYIRLARLLQHSGDVELSLQACSNARKAANKLTYDSHQFLHIRASAALQFGRTLAAMGDYEASLELTEEAEELSSKTLMKAPDAPVYRDAWIGVLHQKASVLAALESHDTVDELLAVVELERTKLSHDFPDVLAMNLHHALMQLATVNDKNPLDTVPKVVEQAVESCPNNPQSWLALAFAKYRMKLPEESLQAIKQVEQCYGGRAVGHYEFLRAMCHHKLGNVDAASESFVKASEWTDRFQPGNERIAEVRRACIVTLSSNTDQASNTP